MIELTQEQLKKLQQIELEMLLEVDRICKKHSIKYTMIAGTMLGAVRHGGFIPWDDDADIGMLREEYERFREICKTELNTNYYYFQDYRNTKGYRWGYGKIRRKDTVFMRDGQEHMPYEQGVFIDIFPMDNIPDKYWVRWIHDKLCFSIRKILWSEVGKKTDKKWLNRMVFKGLNRIPEQSIKNALYAFEKKSNAKKTKYVRMLMFPSPNKVYGYKREWYQQLATYNFEGHKLYGIKEADAYLTFTYGDYMQQPPVKDRKVHPVSEIQL